MWASRAWWTFADPDAALRATEPPPRGRRGGIPHKTWHAVRVVFPPLIPLRDVRLRGPRKDCGGILGHHGVDVEARPPLEPRRIRGAPRDLDVPAHVLRSAPVLVLL